MVSEIYTAIEVSDNRYVYSTDSFMDVEGKCYSLRRKSIYDKKGELIKIVLYKPEGKLEYPRKDLDKDMNLVEYTEAPLNQRWIFEGGHLIKENQVINIIRVNKYLVKTELEGKTTFYKLRK